MSGAQRILVTGAAGFVGSHVAQQLAKMGHHVVGCDNFNDYYSVQLKHDRVAALLTPLGVECVHTELADDSQVHALFDRVRPNLVVHLAAQAGVRYSIDNPAAYVQSNLVGFGHILEACRRHAIAHLLYASSSSVYGNNAKVPFSESDQVDAPVSLYAATKKSNELMAHSYSHLFQLPATGLRFFTVYGPWGRPDMAYFSFTRKMTKGETIPVFAEGLLTRDFTYIDDIVEGVVRLLFKPTPSIGTAAPHAVFNIGNDSPVRVLDFIKAIEEVTGIDARKEFLPMQAGDVPATHASIDKLKAWVDFAPTTPLKTGLARFYEWYRHWPGRDA